MKTTTIINEGPKILKTGNVFAKEKANLFCRRFPMSNKMIINGK